MLAVTGGRASTDHDEVNDPGSIYPDLGEQQISMPPLLMIAAYRYMEIGKHGMAFVPLLQHMADNWQDGELSDVSVLVAKLFLWRHVMNQDTVELSELLGGSKLGRYALEVCVPTSDYEVHKVGEQLSSVEFEQLLQNAECQWAFIGPQNHLSDSWLLRRAADHALVVVYLQSKKRWLREAMQYGKLVEEAAERWDVLGVEDVMLYVTDQHPPRRSARRPFQAPKPMVLIEPAEHARFYGACASLLKSQPTTKRRR